MPLFSRNSPSASSTPIPKCDDTVSLAQDTDALQRFTATGRPNIPSDFVPQAPQHLPQKFTDDSVLKIPIPVSDLSDSTDISTTSPSTESSTLPAANNKETPRRSSVLRKLKGKDKIEKKGDFVMVDMTRREYLMYWAKDEEGRYVGTELEGEGRRRLRERGVI
ncbi:MAG: hypothetical protein Q9176_005973 [Flavoplaca citrina]